SGSSASVGSQSASRSLLVSPPAESKKTIEKSELPAASEANIRLVQRHPIDRPVAVVAQEPETREPEPAVVQSEPVARPEAISAEAPQSPTTQRAPIESKVAETPVVDVTQAPETHEP